MVDQNSFHNRFNVSVDPIEARRRFVNRVHNTVYGILIDMMKTYGSEISRDYLAYLAADRLGEKAKVGNNHRIESYAGDDFDSNLQVIEAFCQALKEEVEKNSRLAHALEAFDEIILNILNQSEVDLSIRWHEGKFYPAGAEELDNALVNDNLHWLRDPKYANVRGPFEKGIDHLLHARSKPELYQDVITDLYEALEALSKIVTEKDKELSANRELFIKNLKLSTGYSHILREYIDFACDYRHGVGESKQREIPKEREVESFVYLTGLFIRLAVQPTDEG